MTFIKRMTELYGAAPMFIIISTLFAISELTVMWVVVPASGGMLKTQQDMLMDSLLDEDGEVKISKDVSAAIVETRMVSNRLNNDPASWQHPLVVKNPYQKQIVEQAEVITAEKPSQTKILHRRWVEIADRAILELELTSVMKGNSSLANISGSIYQQGDTLLLPNAVGAFVIEEVRSGSVLLRLVIDDEKMLTEFGEITRILFIAGSTNTNNTYVDAGKQQ
jgi:hypothetical protein